MNCAAGAVELRDRATPADFRQNRSMAFRWWQGCLRGAVMPVTGQC